MLNLKGVTVQNLVACDLYITQDTTTDYFTNPPTAWDDDTVFWATFDGDLNAGDITTKIAYLLTHVAQIKVKRAIKGTEDWITLRTYNIDDERANLTFSFNDNTAVNDTEYTYAVVYVSKNTGAESEYITADVLSKFRGTFIGDMDTMYKFIADVSYGNTEKHQNVGMFEPIGRKFPIYVANADTNYSTGSMKGKILGDYLDTNVLDRKQIVQITNNVLNFLTNKKAKILKDSNGNAWIVVITDNPSVEYVNEMGRSIVDLNFSWSEVADIEDLESVGFVKTI